MASTIPEAAGHRTILRRIDHRIDAPAIGRSDERFIRAVAAALRARR
jgi:hypothetical protein